MPFVDFEATGFADNSLNVNRSADSVTWDDVFKAAITVGHRDEAALRQYGVTSWFEALSRLFRIRMSLTEGIGGQIQVTDLFRAMDPSEKAVVSYYLGLTFCKLYAERHLRTPWLMHHDVYRKYLGSNLVGVRPDLVGLSVDNRWAVLEAKGCRRGPSPPAKTRAKNQARGLGSVRGVPVTWCAVSWTRIYKNRLCVFWDDPPPSKEGNAEESLNLTPDEMLKHYYRPLVALEMITGSALTQMSGPIASLFSEMGLSIEIDQKLRTMLHDDGYVRAYHYLSERGRTFTGIPNASDFGLDGIRVHVG